MQHLTAVAYLLRQWLFQHQSRPTAFHDRIVYRPDAESKTQPIAQKFDTPRARKARALAVEILCE